MNRFCELVGCRLPIQPAGMTRVTTPALVSAVAEAGGLDMLAVGRQGVEATEAEVDATLALTTEPVGASVIAKFLVPDTVAYLAERLPVVEFFWGWPEAGLVPAGPVVGWQVGSVEEAVAAADAGCRYVVAQGVEAGGHVRGTVALAELVPAARAAVDIPVVAAGGIGTVADVRRALDLGADAVRVGTGFLAAVEADVHPGDAAALVAATGADTALTEVFDVGWPDAPTRALSCSVTAALAAGPDPVATMVLLDGTCRELPRRGPTPPPSTARGDVAAMAFYAGTGVGAVTGRTAAASIVAVPSTTFGEG
jgi:NAD(P)H-dependent flavin oxidoreductase YrpB (nitropropane dioxygenase family)